MFIYIVIYAVNYNTEKQKLECVAAPVQNEECRVNWCHVRVPASPVCRQALRGDRDDVSGLKVVLGCPKRPNQTSCSPLPPPPPSISPQCEEITVIFLVK